MIVLGVDPGLARTGIGLIRGQGAHVASYAFGCIETGKDLALALRLQIIYQKISDLLESEKPDLMIVEDIFSLGQYPKSGILLGKVTGAILVAGSRNAIEVREVAVREAKKILTGNGRASKNQLERVVREALKHTEPIKPDHASDALALALVGLYRFS